MQTSLIIKTACNIKHYTLIFKQEKKGKLFKQILQTDLVKGHLQISLLILNEFEVACRVRVAHLKVFKSKTTIFSQFFLINF